MSRPTRFHFDRCKDQVAEKLGRTKRYGKATWGELLAVASERCHKKQEKVSQGWARDR